MGIPFAGRLLGLLFLLFSTALLPPIIFSLLYDDGQVGYFDFTLLAFCLARLLLVLIPQRGRHRMKTRNVFLVVTLLWRLEIFIVQVLFSPAFWRK